MVSDWMMVLDPVRVIGICTGLAVVTAMDSDCVVARDSDWVVAMDSEVAPWQQHHHASLLKLSTKQVSVSGLGRFAAMDSD